MLEFPEVEKKTLIRFAGGVILMAVVFGTAIWFLV